MKIILVGILAFTAWSAPSTYYYVCNIRMLCPGEQIENTMAKKPMKEVKSIKEEPISEPEPEKVLPIPEDYTLYHEFGEVAFVSENEFSAYVQKLSAYISSNEESSVVVIGNTDSKGSDSFNYKLGWNRADYVSSEMVKYGFSKENIETLSMGETSPVSDNSSEQGRAQNRRTEIKIKTGN